MKGKRPPVVTGQQRRVGRVRDRRVRVVFLLLVRCLPWWATATSGSQNVGFRMMEDLRGLVSELCEIIGKSMESCCAVDISLEVGE
jgi:hypothetical protein